MIQFVAELCEPVGPFTFAGYGGTVAMLRHRIHQASSAVTTGVFAAEEQVQEVMRAWVDEVPVPATIGVLLDLFAAPPPEAGHGRHLEQWRDQVTELLYLCGRRDHAALAAGLASRGEALAPLAEELREWFAEDEAPTS